MCAARQKEMARSAKQHTADQETETTSENGSWSSCLVWTTCTKAPDQGGKLTLVCLKWTTSDSSDLRMVEK
ncbi:hypothetical protein AMECASPLE_037858 [Ameca splendens]|uniref:Uncharacterized protein n=1 Tax=Ameca splendens TaxID=208324 RepID=A0ABV0ZHP6_9TELE